MKFAALTIASEQVWPTLQFLMLCKQLADKGGNQLAKVVVLSTNDPHFSSQPAKSLSRFCSDQLGIKVTSVPLADTDPSTVRKALAHSLDGDNYWILNYTNGTKPMTMPIAEQAARPNTSVLYKERNKPWYRLRLNQASNVQELVLEELNVPDASLDELGVEKLVKVSLGLENETFEAILEWERVTLDEVIRSGFAWNDLNTPNKTDAFERFVASSIQDCVPGAKVCMNLKVTGSSGKTLFESDIVVLWKGQLFLIDCSLMAHMDSRHGSVVSQIEVAHSRISKLGGIGASVVLIRPTWTDVDEVFLNYAKRLRVMIWDETGCVELYSRLGELFGVPSSDAVMELQGRLSGEGRLVLNVRSSVKGAKGRRTFLDLEPTIKSLLEEQNAVALKCGSLSAIFTDGGNSWLPGGWMVSKDGKILLRLDGFERAKGVLENPSVALERLWDQTDQE